MTYIKRSGWFKIHRSILNWESYDNKNVKALFIHLILKANIEDKRWHGKIIKKGCLYTSLSLLSQEVGLSRNQIETALKRLKKTGEIIIKSENKGTLITLVNYAQYQDSTCQKGTQGWIKIHRSILDWEWYDDINVKTIFIHLILKANIEDKKWHGKIIRRGSLHTSYEHLSQETKLSIDQIRCVFKKLTSTGEITLKSTNKGTTVTLVNYGVYQDKDCEVTKQSTYQQHANTKERPTTKEVKKIKSKEDYLITLNNIKEEYKLSQEMIKLIEEWLIYKTEKGQQYKKTGLFFFVKRLLKLSSGDTKVARETIERSMSNNYAGIFTLKNKYNDYITKSDGKPSNFLQSGEEQDYNSSFTN